LGEKSKHTNIVYTVIVLKNVTLSAHEDLIERARLVARSRKTTLNAAFRQWLEQFTSQEGSARDVDALMERLRHVRAGRRFGREEMNAR
jgi:hypothetical protein